MKRILRKRVHEKSIVFILIFSIIISVLGTDTGCAAANASENYLPLELLQFEDRRKDNVINAYDDTAIICELYGIDYYEDNRIPGQEQDNNYNQLDCLYDKDGNLIEIAKPLNNQKVNRQYSTLEIIQKLPDIIHKQAIYCCFQNS